MKLTEAAYPSGRVPVEGYGPGFFRVGGIVHEGGIILSARGVSPWAGPQDRAALLALADDADVLLLGMGAQIALPPAELIAALAEGGLMAEAMSSPSAARSYNVLLSEGRRVAAALLPV